jgi:hypothetical protein
MPDLNIVLIFGSAPDVTEIRQWDLSFFTSTVAINNAWQVVPNWNYLIFPEDFPSERRPELPAGSDKRLITADEFVTHQNNFGGFIYAGGTMAFTAGYWALGALKPDIIAFIGCDMVYSVERGKSSHFYGHGYADPLRNDITLQSLEAKSNRLMAFANKRNCAILNLSSMPNSRLTFPRLSFSDFQEMHNHEEFFNNQKHFLDLEKLNLAMATEESLAYLVPSGRYWEKINHFDPAKLRLIDDIWIDCFKKIEMSKVN